MIKIRLNMIEAKCNYKGKFKTDLKCDLCKHDNDTTEHILECRMNDANITANVEDIRKSEYKIVKQIEKVLKKREELGYKIIIGGNDEEDEED